jgi:hypothetical protein
LIAAAYLLLSKFISLLIVGNTTLVQTEEKSLALYIGGADVTVKKIPTPIQIILLKKI